MNQPLAAVIFFIPLMSLATEVDVGIHKIHSETDSAVVIQKAPLPRLTNPDYEIVSGSEEIPGDPAPGLKESYASWKQACAEWKKEKRELNPGQVLTLHCGTPTRETQPDHQIVQKSTGSYKLRVKIRDSK
jgi:hypothetical protein